MYLIMLHGDKNNVNKVKNGSFKHSYLLSTEEQEVIASAAKRTRILDMSDSKKIINFKF